MIIIVIIIIIITTTIIVIIIIIILIPIIIKPGPYPIAEEVESRGSLLRRLKIHQNQTGVLPQATIRL
jgi:hypothetical protein